MILIDEYFRQYPARRRVVEFLLRHGISVRNSSMLLDGVTLSVSEVAEATGVNRKAVYLAVETIECTDALRILFENLGQELNVASMAPVMGWETLELGVEGSPAEVLGNVLKKITADGNDVVAVNLRKLPGEGVYLSIVVEKPLGGRALGEIGRIPGVMRILVKTPERDKTRLVCTFCGVKDCPRRLKGGGNVAD